MPEFNYSAPLMGTELDVILVNDQKADEVFNHILKIGRDIESQFSRFIASSELSQLNQKRAQSSSALMLELLGTARDLYQQSNGLFNPLLSPFHLGYNQDFKKHGASFTAQNQIFNDELSAVLIEENQISLQPNQTLDFGGFLKGWTVQRMSQLTANVQGSLINLGGDIYVSGRDVSTENFELEIDNPVKQNQPVSVSLKNEALATSGTYKRKWGDKHHILDARLGDSSQSDLVSASVIGPDGAQADATATVAIVLGKTKALEFIDRLGLRCVLIDNNGVITKNF